MGKILSFYQFNINKWGQLLHTDLSWEQLWEKNFLRPKELMPAVQHGQEIICWVFYFFPHSHHQDASGSYILVGEPGRLKLLTIISDSENPSWFFAFTQYSRSSPRSPHSRVDAAEAKRSGWSSTRSLGFWNALVELHFWHDNVDGRWCSCSGIQRGEGPRTRWDVMENLRICEEKSLVCEVRD